MKWSKSKDTRIGWQYTGATIYEADGFRIWKGKYRIVSVIYSADKWHLERMSDHKIVYSARTAKECMAAYERKEFYA